MAAARFAPRARTDGSLKLPVSVVGALDEAGVGVEGTASKGLLEVLEAGAGAAGGAGVEITAGTGVDGGTADEEDTVVDELPGTTLGF